MNLKGTGTLSACRGREMERKRNGTLSDYTLRRIANLENSGDNNRKKAIIEISALKNELGEDYLQKEKDRQKDLSKEIRSL